MIVVFVTTCMCVKDYKTFYLNIYKKENNYRIIVIIRYYVDLNLEDINISYELDANRGENS